MTCIALAKARLSTFLILEEIRKCREGGSCLRSIPGGQTDCGKRVGFAAGWVNAGLKGSRKNAGLLCELAEEIAQGLKAPKILLYLRHATHKLRGCPGRALIQSVARSHLRFNGV